MIRLAAAALPVTLSVRLYRLFLTMYPKSFRQEYGPHMLQVFQDYSIRTYVRSGPPGMLSLWALTLLDLLRSVVEQHLQRETFMSKNTLIRLSGWALAAGGLVAALGFSTFLLSDEPGGSAFRLTGTLEVVVVAAFFFGPLFISLGLLGLRARFGAAMGKLVSAALLLGAMVGGGLIIVGDAIQFLTNDRGDNGFGIWAYGLILTFASIELYGLLALRRQPQPRWNGLAAVAGAPIVLVALIAVVSGSSSEPSAIVSLTFAAMSIVMGIALAMLGYLVQSDLSVEITPEPASA